MNKEDKIRRYLELAGVAKAQKLTLNSILKEIDVSLNDDDISELIEAMIPIYEKYIPESHLDALIPVMDTDAGRNIIVHYEDIMNESKVVIEKILQRIVEKIEIKTLN